MIFVFPVSPGIRFVMNFVVPVFFVIRFFGPKPKRGEKKTEPLVRKVNIIHFKKTGDTRLLLTRINNSHYRKDNWLVAAKRS